MNKFTTCKLEYTQVVLHQPWSGIAWMVWISAVDARSNIRTAPDSYTASSRTLEPTVVNCIDMTIPETLSEKSKPTIIIVLWIKAWNRLPSVHIKYYNLKRLGTESTFFTFDPSWSGKAAKIVGHLSLKRHIWSVSLIGPRNDTLSKK
mgnify:CR=1 FL=1